MARVGYLGFSSRGAGRFLETRLHVGRALEVLPSVREPGGDAQKTGDHGDDDYVVHA